MIEATGTQYGVVPSAESQAFCAEAGKLSIPSRSFNGAKWPSS